MFESFLFFNDKSEVLKVKEFLTRRKIKFERKGYFIFIFDKIEKDHKVFNYKCNIFLRCNDTKTRVTWVEAKRSFKWRS